MATHAPRGGSVQRGTGPRGTARSRGGQVDADRDARDYGDDDPGDFDVIYDFLPPESGGARSAPARRAGAASPSPGRAGAAKPGGASSRSASSNGANSSGAKPGG